MSATLLLSTVAGNVALLLWGLHMVHTGLARAFGAELRRLLAAAVERRWKALLVGLGVTAAMQSSNATGLMAAGFVDAELMSLASALAVMLGANIGTTIIVQLLSFHVAAAAPILVLAGFAAFRSAPSTRVRDLGRVGIGLGLILVALSAIVAAFEPVEHSRVLLDVLRASSREVYLNVLLGALLAWAAHSSVVVVLLVMTLAGAHAIDLLAAMTLVVGANLGTGLPQLVAARKSQAALRLAAGNVAIKVVGCGIALSALSILLDALPKLGADEAHQVASFHMIFNLALAALFYPFVDDLARLLDRLIADRDTPPDRSEPRYLAEEPVLSEAGVALTQAEREVLRIVDLVEEMMRTLGEALLTGDRKKLAAVARLDDTVDRLHRSVKSYLTEIARRSDLSDKDEQRCTQLLAFTVNLEHVGDIIDRSLRVLAAKKIKYQLTFSPEGQAEIVDMHRHVLAQLRLAASVLMTNDPRVARSLVGEKLAMRDLEDTTARNHFKRLRDGKTLSIETSALHLDVVRDLKRITAHLASVAYPVLEPLGELRRSRLGDGS